MSSPVVYLKGDLMYLFYSALSDPNPPDSGSVTAGMRRMKSYDGLTFDDDQEVFAFDETGLAGSGDEIYPAYVGLDSDRTPVMIYHTDGFAVYQLSGTDIHTWTVATSSLELAAGENRWWSNFVKTPGGDTGFLLCSHGSDDEFEIYACDQSDFAALNGVTPTTQAFSALGLYLHATVWREYNRYLAVGYDGDTNPDISIKLLSIGDW